MSPLNKLIWFVNGINGYTRQGFDKASINFDNRELNVSLSNRAIMITGSNSGIGKATAIEVARRGATVYMVCRNLEKAQVAQREIINASNNQRVYLYIVDMSQPRQVFQFARRFLQSNMPLDILINNAGCLERERQFADGGLELNFATNTLGTHILTKSLIPVLAKSSRPRVIVVSSGGMLLEKLNPYDLNSNQMRKFDGETVYAQNKRQQVVLVESYARQYPFIYFATMHPGWADTPAVQSALPQFRKALLSRLRSPEQGADTLVWMCTSPFLEQYENGAFFQDRWPVSKHLPLAGTRVDANTELVFIHEMDKLYNVFSY